MTRAFVSSTFQDLAEHRAYVIDALRKAGISVDPMEDWSAATDEPKVFSRARMAGCDLCVLLVARRRGHVPAGEVRSITQLEYDAACEDGIDTLVFLLDDKAPWYAEFDERLADPGVATWRAALQEARGVSLFGLEPETVEIAPAISRWLQERGPARRARSSVEMVQRDGETAFRIVMRSGDRVELDGGRLAEPYEAPEFASFTTPLGSVPLDELYVLPYARPAAWLEATGSSAGGDDAMLESPLEVTAQLRRTVVVGAPGIGKTSFARFLTRELAKQSSDLPLFVPLAEYVAAADTGLLEFALQRFAGHFDEVELAAVRELALEFDRRGELRYILDGLDEVPAADRPALLREVRRLRSFVLTSRPIGRIEVNQEIGGTLELQPFDDASLGRFVRNWEACGLAIGFSAARLLEYIGADVQLTDLARIPQLATILCWLWGEGDVQRYRTRAELLTEATDRLLDRTIAGFGLGPSEQATLRRQAHWSHAELAYAMQFTGTDPAQRVSQDQIIDHVAGRGPAPTAADRVLDVLLSSGLLVPTDGRATSFRFLHPLFQEFLAAEWLLHGDELESQLDAILLRRSAEEVLRIATALAQDTGQVQPIISRLTAPEATDVFRLNWLQAAQCLAEVSDPRRHVGSLLDDLESVLLDGASQWWARDRFAAAMGHVESPTMRERLLEALDDEDRYRRWAAAEGLVAMADPATADAVAARLASEAWLPVRGALARALGAAGDERFIPALVESLRNAEAKDVMASHVGEALGRIGSVGGFEALAALLDDPVLDSAVAFAVASGLPHLGPEAAAQVEGILEAHGFSATFAPADPFADPRADIEDLVEQLESGDPTARTAAVRELARIPDEAAVWPVVAAVGDDDRGVRDAAATALRDFAEDGGLILDVVRSFVPELIGEDPDERMLAADVLTGLRLAPASREVLERSRDELRLDVAELAPAGALRDALEQEDPALAAAAAWLLGLVDGADAGDALADRLAGAEDPNLRTALVRALGARQDERTLAAAPALLESGDPHQALAAIEALGDLGRPAAVPLLLAAADAHPDLVDAVLRALGEIGDPAAVPFALDRLASGDDGVAQAAARALGRLRQADAVAGLVATLGRGDDAAVAAALALGEIGDEAAVPALIECLDRESVDLRVAAAESLGAIGDEAVVDRLVEMLLHDPAEPARDAAADALGEIAHAQTLGSLLETVRDDLDERRVLRAFAAALLAADDEAHRDTLVQMLSDHEIAARCSPTHRIAQIWHAGGMYRLEKPRGEQPTADELTDQLFDGDGVERWAAAVSLGSVGALEAAAALVLTLADPDVWAASAAADVLDDMHNEDAQRSEVEAAARRAAAHLHESGRARDFLDVFADDPAVAEEQATTLNWALAQTVLLCDLLATGAAVFTGVLWEIATRHELRLMTDGTVVLPTGERLGCAEAVDWLERR